MHVSKTIRVTNLAVEQIQKYDFKLGLPLEFEIVDLGRTYREKLKMMAIPHRAQFFHVMWLDKGTKATHYIDFNPIKLEPGTLIFIPNNSVNLFDKNGYYEGKAIIFTANFFSKNPGDAQFLNSSVLFSDLYDITKMRVTSNTFHILFGAMETEFLQAPDGVQYDILKNLLHSFLLLAEREIRKQGFKEIKPSANLDYVLLYKDLIEKNYKKEKAVHHYASSMSITEKQLYKATTNVLDKTPKQLIDDRILLEAKRLLVHTHVNIKEVAYNLGFEEPTNFIKYFKKHTTQTPSGFRESYHVW